MRRSKRIKYILPIVLVLLLGFLCINCAAPDTTTPVDREGKSFIWKITSDSTFVYLLGSVHVADADTYPLASIIENAFTEADILVVEFNINEIGEMESIALILEHASYPPGEGLQSNLPEELYEKLDEQFAKWGLGLVMLDGYRPWFIENFLEVTSLQELGYSSEYGIDLHFLDAAAFKNLEIVELETEEFQIKMLAGIPDDIVIKLIEMNLDEPLTAQDIEELLEIWETGDAVAMEELLFEGLDEEPKLAPYFESLFTDRNYTMLEKIEGFLDDDEIYFIVVGAGHLVGEEGLLSMLDEAGYTVEQLGN